jgi:hypothetical protein
MPPNPIFSPSAYAVSRAVAYADVDGSALLVTAANPLPVTLAEPGAPAQPALSGSTATALIAGPYAPVTGRPVVLELEGVWQGLVKVLRSTNGGATKLPLTVGGAAWAQFGTNCCEPVWEESEGGAQLYLDIAPTSGALTYRLAQ